MTNDEYVPDEDLVIEAWKRYSGAQDAKHARLSDGDAGDEARRFLARVRRDAWAEGCRAAEQYYRRTVVGIPGLDPIPAPVNPHEETP